MPQTPLTEDQRRVLRERLALARAKQAAQRAAKKQSPPPSATPTLSPALPGPPLPYIQWTEQQWMNFSIEDCRARLALLKVDFETGSRIVGQRPDVNDPRTYRCFVCQKRVAERSPSGQGPGWVWKHDYLDKKTGLYQSVVICTQDCHSRFSNDTRLQRTLKDLVEGIIEGPGRAA